MPKKRREKQAEDIAAAAATGDAVRAGCAREPAERQVVEPARKAVQPDPMSTRLKELEQALGAAAEATDMFESLLGLCERMEAKCRRIALLNDRIPAWPPLAMLHSAAVMSKRDIVGEVEKLTANMARLGAEYRLVKGEQEDCGSGEEGSANG